MGQTPINADSVSPKVAAGSGGSALGTVIGYLLTQLPLISDAPAAVQAAIVVLVVAAVTFVAGYVKKDPARF